MRLAISVLIVALLMAVASAAAPHRARRQFAAVGNDDLFAGLSSAEDAVCQQTYDTWKDARAQQIEDLVGLVRKRPGREDFSSTRELSATMLGELHAQSAIGALIEHVEYEQKLLEVTELSPLEGYPCAEALCKMDVDAVFEILLYLSKTDARRVSDKSVELLALVVAEVYGLETTANGGLSEGLATIERFAARQPEASRENPNRLLRRLREKKY